MSTPNLQSSQDCFIGGFVRGTELMEADQHRTAFEGGQASESFLSFIEFLNNNRETVG